VATMGVVRCLVPVWWVRGTFRVDVPWHSLSFTPDPKGKQFWTLRGIVENNRASRTEVFHEV
jgi:hypothetical protein